MGPIFNFGKNKRRVEIERSRTEQLALDYENTVLKAFAEVENALIGVNTAGRELEAFNAKNKLLTAYIYFYRALGGGWITPGQEP